MMENVKRERLAYDSKVDRINMLPMEVLDLIFSFLTLKEAAANALVCTGWKNLWTSSPNLDFDGSDSVYGKLRKSGYWFSVLDEARSSFVRWVDGVVASHRNANLEEFRVFCDLGSAHTQSIDRWVAYAFANKVRRLDLNLCNTCIYVPRTYDLAGYGYDAQGFRINYSFPYKNLHGNLKLLKQLTLNSVEVTREGVKYFVANCPLLEGLSLSSCKGLSSLEIIRPSPSFKWLEIYLCHNVETVVVRDSNLVTIKYAGMGTTFVLHAVPLLTHLWVHGVVLRSLDYVAKMFASVLQQIQFLLVHFLGPTYYPQSKLSFEMRNLKQLVVRLSNTHKEKDSLQPFVNLISASPFLERFAIEIPSICGWADADAAAAAAAAVAVGGQRQKKNRLRFLHLEEVKFVGYRGKIAQLELIKLLVGNAAVLRTIIVDPSSFDVHLYRPWHHIQLHEFDKDEMLVRAHAEEQLKHIVPHKISLKIL